jgi:hypothetical protein
MKTSKRILVVALSAGALAALCNATNGRLFIQPNGKVSVQAEGNVLINATCFTSLDGASYTQ